VSGGTGGCTNIIVCQPRRIAAVGLATRVAAELGDPAGVGGLCGYSVRLDSKVSPATRLMFVTTGVLLRRLMSDPELSGEGEGREDAVACGEGGRGRGEGCGMVGGGLCEVLLRHAPQGSQTFTSSGSTGKATRAN
jgi:hypothetical protein